MEWIVIGVLAGSLIASGHATREECEGRALILREKGAKVACERAPRGDASGTITNVYPNGFTIAPPPPGTHYCNGYICSCNGYICD